MRTGLRQALMHFYKTSPTIFNRDLFEQKLDFKLMDHFTLTDTYLESLLIVFNIYVGSQNVTSIGVVTL